jgi:hypothetical protein
MPFGGGIGVMPPLVFGGGGLLNIIFFMLFASAILNFISQFTNGTGRRNGGDDEPWDDK